MEGLRSWTRFETDLKKLKQYYDFTQHLYIKEEGYLVELQKRNEQTLTTGVGLTSHNVHALIKYIKTAYPQKNKELVLISLISLLETYFVRLLKEIFTRDRSYYRSKDMITISKEELFSFSTLEMVGKKYLLQDCRKITSGGLNESVKLYQKYFNIDFCKLSSNWSEFTEVFDRRHLLVHSNGVIDKTYIHKYSSGNLGQKVVISHEYIQKSFLYISEFAENLKHAIITLIPNSKKEISVYSGEKIIPNTYLLLLVVPNANTHLNEIMNLKINDTVCFKHKIVKIIVRNDINLECIFVIDDITIEKILKPLKSLVFIQSKKLIKL